MLPVADAMPVPPTTPTVCAIARMPPILPRPPTGTWSGTVAVTAASIALSEAWTPHQPSAITTTLSAADEHQQRRARRRARRRPPRAAAGRRAASYGRRTRRRPGCRRPRSRAPRPSTSERICFLLSASIASACWASSTWIGPKKPAHSPMLARVRNATQRPGGFSVGSASADRRTCAVARRGSVGGHTAHCARRRSDAFEQEDRDLAVGLLLVLGVRRYCATARSHHSARSAPSATRAR